MEYLVIAVPANQNDFIMRVMLDGTMVHIHMSYNSGGDYWTIGFYDVDNKPIVDGIKIVPNFPLNFFYTAHDIPQGLLFVQTSLTKVGKNAFASGDAKLCYVPV